VWNPKRAFKSVLVAVGLQMTLTQARNAGTRATLASSQNVALFYSSLRYKLFDCKLFDYKLIMGC
jgi:hypothetical protein